MKPSLILLIAAILACWNPAALAQAPLAADSAKRTSTPVKRGSVVKLKAGTALRVQERVVQLAQPNEEFVVLDVRKDQQMIYVSGKDKSGAEIAVAAPLPTATVLDCPNEEVANLISLAASKDQFASALALADNLATTPVKRGEAIAAIYRMKSSVAALASAKIATSAAQAEAKRLSTSKSTSSTLRSWKQEAEKNVRATQAMQREAAAGRETAHKTLLASLELDSLPRVATQEPPIGKTALSPEEAGTLNKAAAKCFLTTPATENAYTHLATLIGRFDGLAVSKGLKIIERIKGTRAQVPNLTDDQFFALWNKLKMVWKVTRIEDLQFLSEQVADSISVAAAAGGAELTLGSVESASVSMTSTKIEYLGSEAFGRAVALVNIYLESNDTDRKTPTRSLDNRTMEDMIIGPKGLAKSLSDADSWRFSGVSKIEFAFGGPNAFGERLFAQIGIRASKFTPSEYIRAGEYLDYSKLWPLSADAGLNEAAFRIRELGGVSDEIWEAIGTLQGMRKLMGEASTPAALSAPNLVLEKGRKQFPNLSETMLRDLASHVAKGMEEFMKEIKTK